MNKPELLTTPDEKEFKILQKTCQDYMDFLDNDDEYSEDSDHAIYIFEAAMKALYGKDVFIWINNRR